MINTKTHEFFPALSPFTANSRKRLASLKQAVLQQSMQMTGSARNRSLKVKQGNSHKKMTTEHSQSHIQQLINNYYANLNKNALDAEQKIIKTLSTADEIKKLKVQPSKHKTQHKLSEINVSPRANPAHRYHTTNESIQQAYTYLNKLRLIVPEFSLQSDNVLNGKSLLGDKALQIKKKDTTQTRLKHSLEKLVIPSADQLKPRIQVMQQSQQKMKPIVISRMYDDETRPIRSSVKKFNKKKVMLKFQPEICGSKQLFGRWNEQQQINRLSPWKSGQFKETKYKFRDSGKFFRKD